MIYNSLCHIAATPIYSVHNRAVFYAALLVNGLVSYCGSNVKQFRADMSFEIIMKSIPFIRRALSANAGVRGALPRRWSVE